MFLSIIFLSFIHDSIYLSSSSTLIFFLFFLSFRQTFLPSDISFCFQLLFTSSLYLITLPHLLLNTTSLQINCPYISSLCFPYTKCNYSNFSHYFSQLTYNSFLYSFSPLSKFTSFFLFRYLSLLNPYFPSIFFYFAFSSLYFLYTLFTFSFHHILSPDFRKLNYFFFNSISSS